MTPDGKQVESSSWRALSPVLLLLRGIGARTITTARERTRPKGVGGRRKDEGEELSMWAEEKGETGHTEPSGLRHAADCIPVPSTQLDILNLSLWLEYAGIMFVSCLSHILACSTAIGKRLAVADGRLPARPAPHSAHVTSAARRPARAKISALHMFHDHLGSLSSPPPCFPVALADADILNSQARWCCACRWPVALAVNTIT